MGQTSLLGNDGLRRLLSLKHTDFKMISLNGNKMPESVLFPYWYAAVAHLASTALSTLNGVEILSLIVSC